MKNLVRKKDGVIGGVFAGLAEYTNTDVSVWRITAILLLIFTCLTIVLPYIVCWIVIPEEE